MRPSLRLVVRYWNGRVWWQMRQKPAKDLAHCTDWKDTSTGAIEAATLLPVFR